ncbi:hypothetical protein L484_019492 [Morus notabilis]|uniref:Uncharacterized protein n=1 Tax=Morus notabilis TaxID=981085 RepID=W9RE20_9ROSA|nr:hypothetical protein L484_019492 [Morus notabilis]
MSLADLVSFPLQTPTCTDDEHQHASFPSSSQPNGLLISTNEKATMENVNGTKLPPPAASQADPAK